MKGMSIWQSDYCNYVVIENYDDDDISDEDYDGNCIFVRTYFSRHL